MSDQAKRALERGRSMVAREKEREEAHMAPIGVGDGAGKTMTVAEKAVLDLLSNPLHNLKVIENAIEQAIIERGDLAINASTASLQAEIKTLEKALREASEQLQAAREFNVEAVGEARAANEKLAAAEAELASVRKAAADGVVGPALRAGLPPEAPTPDPLKEAAPAFPEAASALEQATAAADRADDAAEEAREDKADAKASRATATQRKK